MRRLLLLGCILCLLCCTAHADIPCQCSEKLCTCFIQLGDGGMAVEAIQNALVSQGYLAPNDDATLFDEKTYQAVISFQTAHGLSPTGMMDDDTLTLLLWGMLPGDLDLAQPSSSGLPMWVPTDGGIRRHIDPTCCNMYDPRLVSTRNAELLEMFPCDKCAK